MLAEDEKKVLLDYAAFVMRYNAAFNLTGAKDIDDFFENQVMDAVAARDFFTPFEGRVIHDIGSGAGLPGIVLATLMPSSCFTLLERSTKRSAFLNLAIAHLGLGDRVKVDTRDLSSVKDEIDICTARALGDFSELEKPLYESIKPSGLCLLFKGKLSQTLSSPPSTELWESELIPYSFQSKERCILQLRKRSRLS